MILELAEQIGNPIIPKRYDIEENINKINQIENVTERAITMMLYLM